jgi:hypothetical protein
MFRRRKKIESAMLEKEKTEKSSRAASRYLDDNQL